MLVFLKLLVRDFGFDGRLFESLWAFLRGSRLAILLECLCRDLTFNLSNGFVHWLHEVSF